MVNEFVVVQVGDTWRGVWPSGASGVFYGTSPGEIAKTMMQWAVPESEWEQVPGPDERCLRYTRKPTESPAERVARDIYALLDYDGMTEAEFIRAAAPLIATATAAQVKGLHVHLGQIADIVKPRDEETLIDAVLDLVERNRIGGQYQELAGENAARIQELEAKLKDSRQLLADYTQENESYRDERDHWRQRWEQLRDAVFNDSGRCASVVCFIRRAKGGSVPMMVQWASELLPRLEAALAEPEQPHVS